jgi:hypothetical protein
VNKSSVAKSSFKIRNVLGQNVGMYVDGKHAALLMRKCSDLLICAIQEVLLCRMSCVKIN